MLHGVVLLADHGTVELASTLVVANHTSEDSEAALHLLVVSTDDVTEIGETSVEVSLGGTDGSLGLRAVLLHVLVLVGLGALHTGEVGVEPVASGCEVTGRRET